MTTLNAPTETSDLLSLRQQLIDRLSDFRRRVRTHLLVEGAARVLAEAVALALLSLVLDRWLRLSHPARIVLLVMGLAFLAWEAWRHVLSPLRLDMNLVGLAAALDRRSGRNGRNGNGAPAPVGLISARVATVLELPELLRGPRP